MRTYPRRLLRQRDNNLKAFYRYKKRRRRIAVPGVFYEQLRPVNRQALYRGRLWLRFLFRALFHPEIYFIAVCVGYDTVAFCDRSFQDLH